jgi:hypothetical protein
MKFYPRDTTQLEQWHRKFAWWPTEISNVTVWLETYERRLIRGYEPHQSAGWDTRLLWTDGVPDPRAKETEF